MKRNSFILIAGLLVTLLLAAAGKLGAAETEEIPAAEEAAKPAKAATPSVMLKVSDLAIPKSLGKIEDRFEGTSSRWVIHIQDVHAHFPAQENIGAIVDQLNAVYGIKTVALEGGWLSTSFPNSWGLPNTPKKQMLARTLLEDAYLTGPAYAALFSQMPMTLIGIEDAKLYEQNRQIYLKYLAERKQTSEKIDAHAKKIAEAKKTGFNPELQNFDHSLIEFREGKKADKFLPALISSSETKGIDFSDLDQIVLFKQATEMEKTLVKGKLEAEAQRLMTSFKRTRLSLEELLKSGKIPAEKLEMYPEAKKYLELMKLQDKISHKEFFQQIDEAIGRLKAKLFTSDEEKALDAKSERFLLAKRIVIFQATPDDLKKYEAQKEVIQSDLGEAGLVEELNLGLSFYEIAKQRDKIFFEKITTDPRFEGDIAVVTGGFHTEGLSEQMKAAGISYVVVTPDLGNESPNEELYFKLLQMGPPPSMAGGPLAQSLQFYLRFLEEIFDKQTFPQALAVAESENNLSKAAKLVEGEQPTAFVAGPAVINEGPPQLGTVAATYAGLNDRLENLSPEKQKEEIETVLRTNQEGKETVWFFIRAGALGKILKENPLSAALWDTILANPANKVVLLYQAGEDIPDEALAATGKPNFTLLGEPNIARATHQGKFKTAFNNKMIGIIAADYKDPVLLVLDEQMVSLLLLRPLVTRGWHFSFNDPQTQTLIADLLKDALTKEGLVRKAA